MSGPLDCTNLRKSHGFSLVEILIAVGLISITSLAMATLFSNMSNMSGVLESRSAAADTMTEIRFAFGNEAACNSGLTAANFSTLTIPTTAAPLAAFSLTVNRLSSNLGTPLVLAQTGAPATPRLMVNGINLINWRRIGTSTFYMADLRINFTPTTTGIALSRVVPMNFEAPGAGPTATLTRCSTLPLPPPPATNPLAGWPQHILCGGVVWNLHGAGTYNCFRGGEKQTRSAIMSWDPTTRRLSNVNSPGACSAAGCTDKTMDEFIAEGRAW